LRVGIDPISLLPPEDRPLGNFCQQLVKAPRPVSPVLSSTGRRAGAHIITDEHLGYSGIAKHFGSHHTVNHSERYVRAVIFHTNFAESYHSLLKRGIIGTHHHVSAKHLSRYLREFELRWNIRKLPDGQRAVQVIQQAAGKRLKYRSPTV